MRGGANRSYRGPHYEAPEARLAGVVASSGGNSNDPAWREHVGLAPRLA